MIKVLMPLADGSEEMEAVIVIDTLRRVPWNVTAAGISPGIVTGARGVHLVPDDSLSEIDPLAFDVLVIPGGQAGVEALARDERVLDAVRAFDKAGKWLAAVCAGPLVLQAAGVLAGCRVTCHPAVTLTQAKRLADRVIVDGCLITSQGPGTTLESALAIVRAIEGPAKADKLAQSMVVG